MAPPRTEPRRLEMLGIRLTEDELAAAKALAARASMPAAVYWREVVFAHIAAAKSKEQSE